MLIANRNLCITNKNLALTTLSNDVRLNLSKDIRQARKKEDKGGCYRGMRQP